MRVLVVGLATTGASVVSYTRAAGHEVTVLEDRPTTDDGYRARAEAAVGVGAVLVERPEANDAAAHGRAADLVVPSPGVRPDHPAVVAAHEAGVPVRSEIDLAAARLRARPDAPRLVAVTGTNGKTTVTTLIDAVLRSAGVSDAAAGNIGRPLLDAVGDDVRVVVAEVSSFQLAFTTDAFVPDVAVLLNVAEDHLDWHGSADAYAWAKAQLFAHQGVDGLLVVNGDDVVASRLALDAPGRVTRFTVGPPNGGFGVRDEHLVGPDGVLAPVRVLRSGTEPVSRSARSRFPVRARSRFPFRLMTSPTRWRRRRRRWKWAPTSTRSPGPLRSSVVSPTASSWCATWAVSASTTTRRPRTRTPPRSALAGFEHVVLIVGGRNKALDLRGLREHAPRLRAVVAIGEAAGDVEATFAGVVPVVRAASMHEAVQAATARAQPGDAVLLSPACASFDWYESYAARGDDFAREVGLLACGDRDPATCPNGEPATRPNGESA